MTPSTPSSPSTSAARSRTATGDRWRKSLGLDDEAVRIRGTVMGGGFGGKEDITGQIHAALAAQVTGRPVKILYTREESLRVHPKRHATVIRVRTGAKRDGTLTAVEAELYGDSGAYASLGEKVMTRATTHATGPYDVPNAKVDCYAMYTNNAPCGAFRGFGVTQSAFAVESNMDILAAELGMDPVELRRKNALRVGATTATGQLLRESVGLLDCLDAGGGRHPPGRAAIMPWQTWQEGTQTLRLGRGRRLQEHRPGRRRAGQGRGRGRGLRRRPRRDSHQQRGDGPEPGGRAGRVHRGGAGPALRPRQRARHGHGPRARRRPHHGQPPDLRQRQRRAPGRAHHARADAGRAGGEVRRAAGGDRLPRRTGLRGRGAAGAGARQQRRQRRKRAWDERQAQERRPQISFAEAVQAMLAEGREAKLRYEYWAPKTQPLGTGGDMHFAFSYAVHAALVSVDVETGEIAVEKVVTAHDVGRAINPLSLAGQIEGGIVMGMGNALTEHYITENGVPWTRHLGQYKMPGIKMTPQMENYFVEDATADGPYGAKGVGEISSIPISPAIANAIRNAVGVRSLALPIDQDALLLAMRHGDTEIDACWGDA